MQPNQIRSATDEDLFDWMANAIATTSCIGHTKANMNEIFARNYRDELMSRGHDIPVIDFWECFDGDDSYRRALEEKGTYNGVGAF